MNDWAKSIRWRPLLASDCRCTPRFVPSQQCKRNKNKNLQQEGKKKRKKRQNIENEWKVKQTFSPRTGCETAYKLYSINEPWNAFWPWNDKMRPATFVPSYIMCRGGCWKVWSRGRILPLQWGPAERRYSTQKQTWNFVFFFTLIQQLWIQLNASAEPRRVVLGQNTTSTWESEGVKKKYTMLSLPGIQPTAKSCPHNFKQRHTHVGGTAEPPKKYCNTQTGAGPI